MSLTTPGLIFVVRGLVNLLIPVAGVYGGLYVLGDVIDLPIPPLTKWIAAICTSPLLAISKSAWARFREAREARKMGATPVPVLNGKWIGNFDILLALKKGFEVGYPGTPCYLCSLIFIFFAYSPCSGSILAYFRQAWTYRKPSGVWAESNLHDGTRSY